MIVCYMTVTSIKKTTMTRYSHESHPPPSTGKALENKNARRGWGGGKQGSTQNPATQPESPGQPSGSSSFGDTAAALRSWEMGPPGEAGNPSPAISPRGLHWPKLPICDPGTGSFKAPKSDFTPEPRGPTGDLPWRNPGRAGPGRL